MLRKTRHMRLIEKLRKWWPLLRVAHLIIWTFIVHLPNLFKKDEWKAR